MTPTFAWPCYQALSLAYGILCILVLRDLWLSHSPNFDYVICPIANGDTMLTREIDSTIPFSFATTTNVELIISS